MQLDRFKEPPAFGPMCDILWSDPLEDFGNDPFGRFLIDSLKLYGVDGVDEYDPSYSKNGRYIVFSSNRDAIVQQP